MFPRLIRAVGFLSLVFATSSPVSTSVVSTSVVSEAEILAEEFNPFHAILKECQSRTCSCACCGPKQQCPTVLYGRLHAVWEGLDPWAYHSTLGRLFQQDRAEYLKQKKQRDAAFRASAVKFEQRRVALADGTPIGDGLYATRPIAKGETILIEQSVLDTASLSNLYPGENLNHNIRHLLAEWIAPRTDAATDGSTTDDRPAWLTDATLQRWETLLSTHLQEFSKRSDVGGRLPYLAKTALQHLLARAGTNTDPMRHLKLLQKNAYNGKLFPIGSLVNNDEWRANVQFIVWDVIFPGEKCGEKTANNPPFHIHNNRFGRMIAERDIAAGEELKAAYMLGGDVLEHAVELLFSRRTATFLRKVAVGDARLRFAREPEADSLEAGERQSSSSARSEPAEEFLERRSPSSALSLSDAIAAVVKELVAVEKRQLLANWGIPFWSGYSQTDEDIAVSEVEAEVMRRIRRELFPPHTRAPPP